MDPVSIFSLVSACVGLTARLSSLIDSTAQLVARFRDAERSITRLTNQLRLFQATTEELQIWLKRNPSVSQRATAALRGSLSSCETFIADIEQHVATVQASPSTSDLGVGGRLRHAWDEAAMNQHKRNILTAMQAMDIYLSMLARNDPADQDRVLDDQHTRTVFGRVDDDAQTVRSAWGAGDTSTLSPTKENFGRGSRHAATVKRRSLSGMMKSLAMTPANREKLAQELHMACENRDMSKATLLLTKGVSPNQKTPFGRLPLFTAIEAGQYNMVKLLLDHGSKVNQERKIYNSNLSDRIYLANGGWLLPRETPLSTAIGTRNVGIVKLLIQYGADVATKESTQLPLLFKSIASNEAAILKILLDNGGDSEVNYKGTVKDGTPLMTAIKADNVEMVRYLLDYGADPNGVQQRVGFTPLCYAIHLNGNVHGIVSLLVGRGVNVDERCELYGHFGTFSWLTQRRDHVGYLTHIGGLTAVYLAARRDTHLPTLKLLLSHGANPNTRLTYRDDYSNPNKVRTVPGPTPLQDAANGEVVKLLVQHGASLSVMDHHSRAP